MDQAELKDKATQVLMVNMQIQALEKDAAHFAAEIGWRHRQMEMATVNHNTSKAQMETMGKNFAFMCGELVKNIPELRSQKFDTEEERQEAVVAYCQRVVQAQAQG